MMAIRTARALVLALVLSLGAVFAQAQDGLQRFEKEIKPQLELKSLTYSSGKALGDKGFVLEKVVAVMPASDATGGKDSTVRIEKVIVEEIDFERLDPKKDDLPRYAKLGIEGITGDDDLGAMLQEYGIPKVPADMVLDYRIDSAAKVLTLNKLEIALRGQASVTVDLILDGVSDKASEVDSTKDSTRLRVGNLVLNDSGLLAQLVPAIAKQQGAPPEALVAMAAAGVASLGQGQGPETMKALDALVSFIGDWEKPKGPFKVSIRPAKGATMADLDKISEPDALSKVLGLTVDYAGTRPGAASGK